MSRIKRVAIWIFFAPLMLILSIIERVTGKRSPYWPFKRGQE